MTDLKAPGAGLDTPGARPAPYPGRWNRPSGPAAHFPDLTGRIAVVTGGSRGIGAATAELLAANGMYVAVVGRDQAALDDVRERLWNAGRRGIAIAADCSDPAALAACAEQVSAELGEPDVLAAFAGGAGRPQPSLSMPLADFRAVLDSDLTTTFATIQAFVPGMVARGRGSVITMSSAAGRAPSQANAAYAAAKAGVAMLTRHLAAELAPSGVRVNCLAPSAIRNEKMARAMTDEQIDGLGAAFPLGRIGAPADVAAMAAYLASDVSGWVTGTTTDIAGGKVIR